MHYTCQTQASFLINGVFLYRPTLFQQMFLVWELALEKDVMRR